MSNAIDMAASRKMVISLTTRICARMRAAGVRIIEREDVEQELWLAWSVARQSFDPQRGVPFGAYFYRGAIDHMNGWFRELERRDIKLIGLSLDQNAGEENDRSIHEVVADESIVSADDKLELSERRQKVFERLSPMAKRFVELLDNPPAALYRELDAMKQRALFCRSNGRYASPTPATVTTGMIGDLMGLNRVDRTRVFNEIREVIANAA